MWIKCSVFTAACTFHLDEKAGLKEVSSVAFLHLESMKGYILPSFGSVNDLPSADTI